MPTAREILKLSTSVSPDLYALDSKFLAWYTSYWQHGGMVKEGIKFSGIGNDNNVDIFFTPLASTRFGLGISPDGIPLFGIPNDEGDFFMALLWDEAAFLRRAINRDDWIALACHDARFSKDMGAPVMLRLWFQVSRGLFDGWLKTEEKPKKLTLVEMNPAVAGGRNFSAKQILTLLPLSFLGFGG